MIIISNINYIVDLLVGVPTRDWICQYLKILLPLD